MAHIPPKALHEYPWPVRWVLKRQIRIYGEVLPPAYLWGRTPGLFFGLLTMLGLFSRPSFLISAELRALASIRIAQLNGCHFCVDLNAHLYLEAKGQSHKAEKVADWSSAGDIFSEKEQAVLAYAEAMTDHCASIDAGSIDQLRAHFSDDGITALTAWIAFQNMSAKFNTALGAEPHGFCETPQ
ncbi:MAG TPA: carboxymuconolactone decarboxylase family protein [Wenzhouxiangella sp.]